MRLKLKVLYYALFGILILLGLALGKLVDLFRTKVSIALTVGEAGRRYLIVALKAPVEAGVPDFLPLVRIASPGETFVVALPKGQHWLYAIALDLTDDRVRDLKNAQALLKLDPTVALPLRGNPLSVGPNGSLPAVPAPKGPEST